MHKLVNGVRVEFTPEEEATKLAEWAAADADFQKSAYIKARQVAYAHIADQLDMQYWDAINRTTTWLDHIKSVKDKYPKPSE